MAKSNKLLDGPGFAPEARGPPENDCLLPHTPSKVLPCQCD